MVVAHWLRWKAVLVGVEVPASGRGVQHAWGGLSTASLRPPQNPTLPCHRPSRSTLHLPARSPTRKPARRFFSLVAGRCSRPVAFFPQPCHFLNSTAFPSSPPPEPRTRSPLHTPQSPRPPDFHSPPFFLPCPVIPLRPRLTTGRAWRRVPGSSLPSPPTRHRHLDATETPTTSTKTTTTTTRRRRNDDLLLARPPLFIFLVVANPVRQPSKLLCSAHVHTIK